MLQRSSAGVCERNEAKSPPTEVFARCGGCVSVPWSKRIVRIPSSAYYGSAAEERVDGIGYPAGNVDPGD
ncbi:MAG: hypothetical protein AVDCRST_MAG91-3385 [uncultured Sphingomonadaceae bacterium]|uniref:Uncharacterized protein n=1 Tax=uncultured Sphingomonadaceae bacterium TaxID=169976 RepID=A0A6J4TYI6_9SPHN|nr:MAG: hypothetical protein AVDCRST_MAG91-3385 [uncultured Sphingomonadaceae bacterium]